MQDFNELLKARVVAPLKDKQGNPIVNKETGEHLTAMEAMVMSVVNKAIQGDIASIAFIQNSTKTVNPEEDKARRKEAEARKAEIIADLTIQLKGENLYDGQIQEIEMLAETFYLVEQLTAQMQAADFTATRDEFNKDGSTKIVVNPIIKLRDDQQDRFREQFSQLRRDARMRQQRTRS